MNNVALAAKWSSASSMAMVVPHLLLVDDDRVMRMVLREALQHHGYTVELVSSAEEALELLQRDPQKVDALVLDRQLPGMSGLELVGVMKSDMALASIPVIMLTGSGLQDEIQEGIDAGVHYYLVKPVENTLLHKRWKTNSKSLDLLNK